MLHRVSILLLLACAVHCLDTMAGERLEPPFGCYVGFSIDGSIDSLDGLNSRLGFEAAVLTQFVQFPLTTTDVQVLDATVAQMLPHKGIVMVTLEPMGGLATVTAAAAQDFAQLCAKYEAQGIGGIVVRFAHEMNGPWYPWGQKPTQYIEKFRVVASAVHSATQRTAMLWAPNDGSAYPYGGHPGAADLAVLDTNHDGTLTVADDPYAPYYPGDDVVDWVGVTLYHWGQAYPWGENEIPEPSVFSNKLTGNYNGADGDDRPVPDFYAVYCSDNGHKKPMALAETSAFYNTQRGGAGEFDIKSHWWRQIFNIRGDSSERLDISAHFPKLKMINWLEWRKKESEVQNNLIDWRVTQQITRDAFLADITQLKNGRRYFWNAADIRSGGPPIVQTPPIKIVSAATAAPNPAKAGETISFQVSATGVEPLTYQWNFGDGTQASSAATTHAYSAGGAYHVSVTIQDGAGQTVTQDINVTIAERASVTKFKATLRESNPGRDVVALEVTLPITPPQVGTVVELNVGGTSTQVTVQKSGGRSAGDVRSKVQFKTSKGSPTTHLIATLNGDIASAWRRAGVLTSDELVSVPISVRVGDRMFSTIAPTRLMRKGTSVQVVSAGGN